MAADCLRLPIFLLEATNTSNQLGTKFNDWKCFFVRFKHRISDWWVHDLLQKQRAASKDVGELRAHAAPLWKMVQWWVEYHSGWSSNGECNQKVYHQFARARKIHILCQWEVKGAELSWAPSGFQKTCLCCHNKQLHSQSESVFQLASSSLCVFIIAIQCPKPVVIMAHMQKMMVQNWKCIFK